VADEESTTDAFADAIVLEWAADILKRRNPGAYYTEPYCRAAITWVEYWAQALWQEANRQ
jgi:hypothetical protein